MTYLKKESKVIMYRLAKKTNQTIRQISSCTENRSPTESERLSDKVVLARLKKKGLVGMTLYSYGGLYFLTDEGEKTAKPIVEEIDEYKRW